MKQVHECLESGEDQQVWYSVTLKMKPRNINDNSSFMLEKKKQTKKVNGSSEKKYMELILNIEY